MRPAAALCLGLLAVGLPVPAPASPGVGDGRAQPPVRRALVVAYNGPTGGSLEPLRFADDDGLAWAETLARLGVETVLLTVADTDTARLSPPALGWAMPPTLPNVRAAVARLAADNAADLARGREVDTLVVFVGHGQRDSAGRSELVLMGATLDREALFSQVVDPLGGTYTHVFVDACRAAGVVGGRAGDVEAVQKLHALLEAEQLDARPGVGVLYAESDDGETHEWSRIRGGVFSHAVRSGLLGAADVNGDGRVEYSEIQAFVSASLAGVRSAQSRLTARVFPPSQNPHRALAGPPPPGAVLWLDDSSLATGRLSVEDDLGVRLADLHRAAGESVRLALPQRSAYWLRTAAGETRVTVEDLGRPLQFGPLLVARRGPAEESLREGFFTVAFGRLFYEGFVASAGVVPVAFPAPQQTLSLGVESRRTVGLELAVTGGRAPLDAPTVAVGASLAWRSRGALFLGGRVGYAGTPTLELWGKRTLLHRVSALALVGYQGADPWSPFVELGVGWAYVLVARANSVQGDPLGLTGRFAGGLRRSLGRTRVGVAAALDVDTLRVDGERRFSVNPGLELSLEL